MSLETFSVSAGQRISDATAARILADGIPLEISGVIVRVRNIIHSTNDTQFIVQAVDEADVQTWKNFIHLAVPNVVPWTEPVAENPDPPPSPLDISTKVGTWTKTVGVATTTISGLAGQPKAVFMFGSGLSASAFGTFQEGGGFVLGFTDGTTQRVTGVATQDNSASSNSNTWMGDKTFYILDPTGTASTHIKEKGSVAITADGFTITWDATTLASVGSYLAIWGSDINNVKVKDFTTGTTSTGIVEYTGVGFQSDFGLIMYPPAFEPGAIPVFDTDPTPNFTAIAGNSTVRNWSTGFKESDATGTANCSRLQRTGKLFAGIMFGTSKAKQLADFHSWTADGFKVNWTNGPDFSTDVFYGIFIKGGKWDAGHFAQPDTGGASPTGDVVSLLADQFAVPKAIMCMSVGNIEQTTTTANTNAKFSVGATDGTTQGCTTYASEHLSDPMIVVSKQYNNKLMAHNTPTATATSSTEEGLATIQDMATPGQFTVNYSTNTDAINRQVVWFSLSA